MIAWTAKGTTYWAISSFNLEGLEMFARLFRAAPFCSSPDVRRANASLQTHIRRILLASPLCEPRTASGVASARTDCTRTILVCVAFESLRAFDSCEARISLVDELTSLELCV